MARLRNALADRKIKSLKPGRYADGGGLYLEVKGPDDDPLEAGRPQ